MKLNKSKGKVHPSPSSSSSSSSSPFSLSSSTLTDPVSALNLLLPAAILTLISALSLQDREVLAYMITRSLKSSIVNPSPASILDDNNNHHHRKRKSKKSSSSSSSPPNHKSPSFDCGCFDCYTTYWFRWDSSPHRELIHQAIEAFEEHLATTEQAKKQSGKSRRREKEKAHRQSPVHHPQPVVEESPEILPNVGVSPEIVPEVGVSPVNRESPVAGEKSTVSEERENEVEEEVSGGHQQVQQQQHKGLARKVLPDVIGLFNSRLWNLWGPNV